MKISMFGRKVNLKKNFTDKVEKRLAKLDKFFDDDAEAQLNVTVATGRQTVEVTVKSQGFFYRAERSARDMETAFCEAADLITRQIIKNKDKLGARIKKVEVSAEDVPSEVLDEPATDFEVVRKKHFEVQPMPPEEAILQMTMLGHSFFIFIDSETSELGVVYTRKDGNYGILYPEVK